MSRRRRRSGTSVAEGREPARRPPGGSGAVPDLVLLRGAPLAEGPAANRLLFRLEDRVVAETARPPGCRGDPATARPARGDDRRQPTTGRWVSEGQHAD